MLVIPLVAKPNLLKGLLRLFSSSKIQEKDFDIYQRVGQSVGQFIERITAIRTQLNSLKGNLSSVSEKLELASLEKDVHSCVFEIL
jgi:hypothetical protein